MLSQHNLYPCTGCNVCRQDRPEACILGDDMQMVYDKMLGASAVL